MAFDGIAVSVITKELNARLKNARVMKLYQQDRHSIVIYLRLPGESCKLVVSADPTYPRIHTTMEEQTNPAAPPAFCMLLRKHLEPSRILAISQHELERIILIRFEAYDQRFGQTEKTLILELMGRHSNLILINQENEILDGIHRVSQAENAVRVIMPGVSYTHPPDQGKTNPHTVDKDQFITDIRLLEPQMSLYKGLMLHYQGLGPEAAKEIVQRGRMQPDQLKQTTGPTQWEQLWQAFGAFFSHEHTPILIKRPNGALDFSAYSVTDVVPLETFPNLDSLLDAFYTERTSAKKIQQIGSSLQKQLKTHLQRIMRKEELQRKTLVEAANANKWQKLGDLVTANLHTIKKGDAIVRVVDYYDPSQPTISLELDRALTPSQNAQRLYKKYVKARNSEKITRQQLQKTLRDRRYMEEILMHIELADSLATLWEMREELTRYGYIKPSSLRAEKPLHKGYDEYVSTDGIPIYVGRNNRQNDELTFKIAKPDDIWMHAQKIPGSHVIIQSDQPLPDTTLVQAAMLAAYYSKARTSPKVPVDYTMRKHVRKPGGAKPGYVIYDTFKTITVDPTKNDIPTNKST